VGVHALVAPRTVPVQYYLQEVRRAPYAGHGGARTRHLGRRVFQFCHEDGVASTEAGTLEDFALVYQNQSRHDDAEALFKRECEGQEPKKRDYPALTVDQALGNPHEAQQPNQAAKATRKRP
jgi:hypothetical protein